MVGIRPHLVQQGARRGDDALEQIGIGPEQVEDRRQFLSDPVAHGRQRAFVAQEPACHSQELVEQLLVAPVVAEGRQQFGRQRRQRNLFDLFDEQLRSEALQPRPLDRRQCLRHQPIDEAGEPGRPALVREPVGDERGEVDLFELLADRSSRQEIDFDEPAEIVRDALLIRGNDGRVGNRQAERAAKQRDHGVPVRQPADDGRLGEGRDETEPGTAGPEKLGRDENGRTKHERCNRQRLGAPERHALGGLLSRKPRSGRNHRRLLL